MPVVRKQAKRTIKKRTAKKSVVDRISTMGFDDSDGITLNLYGRSGTGKTTLWSTFPGPILGIICSSIKTSGELRSINTADNRKKIKQVILHEANELNELVAMQRKENKFKTIALDNATGLQDYTLRGILGLDQLPAQGAYGMASQQDWGQCSLMMKEFLRSLLELSCNVVIVAQERSFEQEGDVDNIIAPHIGSALSPSVAGWLGPACDYVCETFIQQRTVTKDVKIGKKTIKKKIKIPGVDYCLRTAPHSIYTTKFRVPKNGHLPEYLVDGTYAKIKKLIDQGG